MTENISLNIPEWISARAWTLKDNSYAAHVFNHKTNESFEFEGFAAGLWQYILDNRSYTEMLDFAKENDFADELDDFLKELSNRGLLTYHNNKNIDMSDYVNKCSEMSYVDILSEERFSKLSASVFMTQLQLDLTYNCNLKCIHCLNDKSLIKQIKFKDIKPVIDEAYELGAFSVTLSGGECTLNKDFIKICEYIRKKKLKLSFFTNGQSLYDDKDLFDKVISLYPYQIALSLYSMKPEIHDKITGVKGSHHKTLSVIKKLRENNINVRINCFLTKYNAYEVGDVEIFAENNKITLVTSGGLLLNPSKSNYHCEITLKQLSDLYCSDCAVFKNEQFWLYVEHAQKSNERICGIEHSSLSIAPDLNIYLCCVNNVLLGNCKSTSLEYIWKNENSKLQELKALKTSDLKDCNKYDYCKYCIYQVCIAESFGYHLELFPRFCDEAKIRMKAAELCGVCSDLHK